MTALEQLHHVVTTGRVDELVDTDPIALRDHLYTAVAEIQRLTTALAAAQPPF